MNRAAETAFARIAADTMRALDRVYASEAEYQAGVDLVVNAVLSNAAGKGASLRGDPPDGDEARARAALQVWLARDPERAHECMRRLLTAHEQSAQRRPL